MGSELYEELDVAFKYLLTVFKDFSELLAVVFSAESDLEVKKKLLLMHREIAASVLHYLKSNVYLDEVLEINELGK